MFARTCVNICQHFFSGVVFEQKLFPSLKHSNKIESRIIFII